MWNTSGKSGTPIISMYSNLLQCTSQLLIGYIQSITRHFYSTSVVLSGDLFVVLWTTTCFEKISKYSIPFDRFSNKFKHIRERCSKMKYFEIFFRNTLSSMGLQIDHLKVRSSCYRIDIRNWRKIYLTCWWFFLIRGVNRKTEPSSPLIFLEKIQPSRPMAEKF